MAKLSRIGFRGEGWKVKEIPQEFLATPVAADVASSCVADFWSSSSGGSKETI